MSELEPLEDAYRRLKPALDASLDPACIVMADGTVHSGNAAFRSLVKKSQRDLDGKCRLLDLLRLTDERDEASLGAAIREGKKFQTVEAPASLEGHKVRLSVKTAAVQLPGAKAGRPLGSLVCLRDSTGEVLVQAKYLKLLKILEEKDQLVSELKDRLDSTRRTPKEKIIR